MTTETTALATRTAPTETSPLRRIATRLGVDPALLLETVKKTITKRDCTNEQMLTFLAVADSYELNPLRREIYAMFGKGGDLIPTVGYDGWAILAARHPLCNGFDFTEHNDAQGNLVSVSCRMWVKGREHPTTITEHHSECYRDTVPWNTMPRRMNRIKAFSQAVRAVLGVSGIYDPDEAERMATAEPLAGSAPRGSTTANARAALEASRTPAAAPATPSGDPDAILEAELAGMETDHPPAYHVPTPTPAPVAPDAAGRVQTPPGGTDAAGGNGGPAGGPDTLDCGGGWTRIVVQGAVPGNAKNAAKSPFMNIITSDGAKYTTFSTRLIPVLAAAREDGEYAYILTDKEGKIVEVRRDPPEPELLG